MIEIDSLVSRTQYLMGIAHCLDRTDATRNCHWSINSRSLTTDYKVVTTLVMRMCHVFPVSGDSGTGGWCGGPALTGAVCRTLETGAAICCNCKVVTSLCSVCSDQGENISPAQRPPDGEDGIHYTLYIQFIILYIIMVRETTPTIIIINCTGNKVKGY